MPGFVPVRATTRNTWQVLEVKRGIVMSQDLITFDEIDKDGPQQRARTYDIPVSDLQGDDVLALGPVSIDVTVAKGDGPAEYLADGTVTFTADLTCARCVDPYPFANHASFH